MHIVSDHTVSHLGQHIVVDFFGIPEEKLVNVKYLQDEMTKAAIASGVTILKTHFSLNNANGVSGILILAESHFIIHTIPEKGIAMLDLYTCGGHTHPEIGFNMLIQALEPQQIKYCTYHRGFKNEDASKVNPTSSEVIHNYGFQIENADFTIHQATA